MIYQPVFLGQLRHPRLHGPQVVSGQLREQVVQRLATAERRGQGMNPRGKTASCSCCMLRVVVRSGLLSISRDLRRDRHQTGYIHEETRYRKKNSRKTKMEKTVQ